MGEEAADHRSEGARRDHDAGEVTLVAPALARRNGLADERLRERHQAAAARPLQDARGGEHLDALRGGAQDRSAHEDGKRDEHHALAAENVAELPVDRRGDGVRYQIGDDDPGRAPDLPQGRGDRRQGRRHDGLIHHRQEHRQHDRGEDVEEQVRARPRRADGGCSGGRRVGGHDRMRASGGMAEVGSGGAADRSRTAAPPP